MSPRPIALGVLLLVGAVSAQTAIVLPSGAATTAGNAFSYAPWGLGAGSVPRARNLSVYDSSDLTNQGVTSPVLITRLRWRPDDGRPAFAGGTFAQATVALATAALDHSFISDSYRANVGSDYSVCYSGPVVHAPGNGTSVGVPAPWSVDVSLITPFYYDPTRGDLVIDVDYFGVGSYSGGSLPAMDAMTPALGSMIGSQSYLVANHTYIYMSWGMVVEVTYVPVTPGVATARIYEQGCYDGSHSFYERFPPGTFDLSNTTLRLTPTPLGYSVDFGPSGWFTPVSSPLALGAYYSAPLPFGFALQYPGGTTSALQVSKFGVLWAQVQPPGSGINVAPPPRIQGLLSNGARWCPLWTTFDVLSGDVYFDTDPANNAAYVTFVGVLEMVSSNPNTFQVAFFSDGRVEYRYQQCTIAQFNSLCGFSPGGGARDPGDRDLSATVPFFTRPDSDPLVFRAVSRPLVGAQVDLVLDAIPLASPFGYLIAGFAAYDPGFDLSAIGMPGCQLVASFNTGLAFQPNAGSGSLALSVPNATALSGVVINLQAGAMAMAANPLGFLSSNGLELRVGTQ